MYATQLLEKEHSGCHALLRDDKVHRHRIFRLVCGFELVLLMLIPSLPFIRLRICQGCIGYFQKYLAVWSLSHTFLSRSVIYFISGCLVFKFIVVLIGLLRTNM